MATFNTAEAEVIMLEIVDPDIGKAFEQEAKLWNMMAAGEGTFTNNRGVRLVTYVEPNPGMGWYAEGGALPVGDTSRKVDMRVFYTRYAISGTITGDAIDVTKEESLLDALSSRMKEDTDTGIKEFNQQLYQDGRGIKGTIDSSVGAITTGALGSVFLNAPYGARQMYRRGTYNFYSQGGTQRTTGISNAVASAVDTGTSKVTFDSVPTDTVNGDVLVYKDSWGRSIHGLPYHVNDDNGQYQGQSRATYPKLKSVVIDANDSELTVSLLDKLLFRMMYRTGGQDLGDIFILSSLTQQHQYMSLGYQAKRWEGDAKKFDGAYTTIEHAGRPWVIDTDCPDDDLYILNKKTWGKYQVRRFGVVDYNGEPLKQIPAYSSAGVGSWTDSYTWYIGGKFEIGCKLPHMNARLKNLNTDNLAGGIFTQ